MNLFDESATNHANNRPLDKRVQSTHSRLVMSLRTLMQQQPFDEINVANICQQANVSRSSYYTHFTGKQALFELSLEFLAKELSSASSGRSLDVTNSFAFLPGFLEHVRSHRNIYLENRFGSGMLVITRNIRAVALGLARNELAASGLAGHRDEFNVLFVIGGVYALVEWWIDAGCKESTDALVGRLDELVKQGLGLTDVSAVSTQV